MNVPELPRLEQGLVLSPITALGFFPSADDGPLYLLAGEGTHLAVYDAATSALRGRIEVFSAQAIYGVAVGRGRGGSVLVWGGQSVTAISRSVLEGHLRSEESAPAVVEVQAPDWIYDGILSSSSSKENEGENRDEDEDEECEARGVLITAHNEVIPFHTTAAAGRAAPERIVLGPLKSPSRPMLFSANLAWLGDGCVLVAAGTVFGEIIVWKYYPGSDGLDLEEREKGEACQVLDVFTGHEGSIFGVSLSPEVTVGHGGRKQRRRLLVSCSDDRTIRVWDVVTDRPRERKVRDMHSAEQGRETGFNNELVATTYAGMGVSGAPVEDDEEQVESLKALAIAMGHASRIWHVKFSCRISKTDEADDILVYSFGEDATAQEWRVDLGLSNGEGHLSAASDAGGSAANKDAYSAVSLGLNKPFLSGQLTHLRTIPCHSGRNIWAGAVLNHAGTPGLVATGGSDGKIVLIGDQNQCEQGPVQDGVFHNVRNQEQQLSVSATVAEILGSPGEFNRENTIADDEAGAARKDVPSTSGPRGKRRHYEDVFQSYAFVAEDRLLATTWAGRIFLANLENGLQWTQVQTAESVTADLTRYSILKSPRGGEAALIGSGSGNLYVYLRDGRLRQVAKLPGKVEDIFFLPHQHERPSADPIGTNGNGQLTVRVLVTMLHQDDGNILELDLATGETISSGSQQFKLGRTSAITSANICGKYLILGSRKGAIHLYREDADGTFNSETRLQTLTRDAIASIVPLPPSRSSRASSSSSSFLTTGRDGKYRIYEISDGTSGASSNTPSVVLRHETAPPFGPIVRDAWFAEGDTDGNLDLILCGFRSMKFVVWNETRQQEITEVECGGAHRMHTYVVRPGNQSWLRFAFTRLSTANIYSQTSSPTRTLKPGGHGREIGAASSNGTYLATGGEDTIIRIWKYESAGGSRGEPTDSSNSSSSASLPKDSTLRCLSVINQHNAGLQCLKWFGQNYLISSAGAEELFVWRVSRLDSQYDRLAVLLESAYPDRTKDGDLRITGLDVGAADAGIGDGDGDDSIGMYITLALSDSTIKTYYYSRASGWRLLARGRYTGACPMHIRHLQLPQAVKTSSTAAASDDRAVVEVLAAFTDGTVSIWRASFTQREAVSGHPAVEAVNEYAMLHAIRAHRGAVKSLDLLCISARGDEDSNDNDDGKRQLSSPSSSRAIVLTGGDDNAIVISMLSRSTSAECGDGYSFYASRYRVSQAHAAAITGIHIVTQRGGEEGRGGGNSEDDDKKATKHYHHHHHHQEVIAVTCSNDQRVRTWRIQLSTRDAPAAGHGIHHCPDGQVRVKLLDSRYSAVADPKDMEPVGSSSGGRAGAGRGEVMVVGVGMEVWKLAATTEERGR